MKPLKEKNHVTELKRTIKTSAVTVSSLVLFIRDKETIQNIHPSVFSLNTDWSSFIYTSLPTRPSSTPTFLKQGTLCLNKYEECYVYYIECQVLPTQQEIKRNHSSFQNCLFDENRKKK
ncbi:hypothetical protein ILYODFUR_036951 [Ilyodon furcidens]|uniref:Uncharacterized protein n=1 Tax=Ilyodon furcidens TaxID=33524 RepID=A0ABV0V0H5_9TELE